VSTGEGGEADMPDVTGDRLRDAQRRLEQEDITDVTVQPTVVNDRDQDGRVIQQSPSAGSRVNSGERVVLVVGEFSGSGNSGQGDGGN
jgi:beta-lactam-binding protein with PASTA domain